MSALVAVVGSEFDSKCLTYIVFHTDTDDFPILPVNNMCLIILVHIIVYMVPDSADFRVVPFLTCRRMEVHFCAFCIHRRPALVEDVECKARLVYSDVIRILQHHSITDEENGH